MRQVDFLYLMPRVLKHQSKPIYDVIVIKDKKLTEVEINAVTGRVGATEVVTPDEEGKEFTDYLNQESKTIIQNAKAEKALAELGKAESCQFVRTGYFIQDSLDTKKDKLVFNRILPLRDSWAKKK